MSELRIIATDKKFQKAPYFLTAKFDEKTKKWITGQNIDWIEEKKDDKITYRYVETEATKKLSFIINPEDSYPLRHLQIFNTDVPSDMALLNLFKTHDIVLAESKKKVIPGVHHFYIENKEDEAVITVNKIEMEYKAMTIIKDLGIDGKKDAARLLAIGKVDKLTTTEVEAALFQRCKENPDNVIKVLADPNSKVKIFLKKLLEKNVVKFDSGKYTYGDEILGLNEQAVVDFLRDKQNAKLVSEFGRLLEQEPVVA